ncbi:MAG: ABC transporter substrate-binding protein, partial [Pseudomonadota bacterium]
MKLAYSLIAGLLAATALSATVEAQTFRTNINADPAMIDPITYSELVAGDVMGNIYEGFTGLDAEGNVVPALAERWEAHDDNLGFTFHLRPDVEFHSGREFTAADVKYTLEELLRPGNKGGLNARYLNNIVGADAMKAGDVVEVAGIEAALVAWAQQLFEGV